MKKVLNQIIIKPFIIITLLLLVLGFYNNSYAQLAKDKPKFLGNIHNGSVTADRNFIKWWNQITPENAGKWGQVQVAGPTSFTWTGLDAAYNFAKNRTNKMYFRLHAFLWGQQYPGWVRTADSATIYNALEEYMKLASTRYTEIDFIDVVNEPLHFDNVSGDAIADVAKIKKAFGGTGTSGWDYVINTFRMAKKYFNKEKLHINDYSIIQSTSATDNYLKIIKLLQDEDLIGGIGVQGHRFELENANTAIMKNNLDKLAATGLPVYITEFDLGNFSNSGTPNDQVQLDSYKKIFPVIWEHPGVKGVTLWGYIQNAIWQSTAFLLRNDLTDRPAFTWLKEYVEKSFTTNVEGELKIPSEFSLSQNYPNPFNPTTTIGFSLPKESNVKIVIYDVLGNQIETVTNSRMSAGNHKVDWKATNLTSGIYLYQITAGIFSQMKKMILIK